MIGVVAVDYMREEGLDLIRRQRGMNLLRVVESGDRNEIREAISGAQAIMVNMTPLDADLLASAGELRAVSRHGVGYDNVDVEYLSERGIPLFLAVGASTGSVAEHALYMALELARRGRDYDRATREGDWSRRWSLASIDLAGRIALVVGFGRIGVVVSRLFKAIGMHVYVCDPALDRAKAEAEGCRAVDDFHDVLDRADIVSVHVPYSKATRGLIGASELSAMKTSAFVLNLARGGIVDEAALAAALRAGAIGGAGIDVFETEPPTASHQLLACPNVILSPHSAALSLEAAIRTSVLTAQNLVDFFAGSPVLGNVANAEILGLGARS